LCLNSVSERIKNYGNSLKIEIEIIIYIPVQKGGDGHGQGGGAKENSLVVNHNNQIDHISGFWESFSSYYVKQVYFSVLIRLFIRHLRV
jgi:hypothetical protein